MADSPVFVDTGYFVALLNRRDPLHPQALALARQWSARRVITTEPVLIELGNFFARSTLRGTAIAAIRRLRAAREIELAAVTPSLFDRAVTRYAAHHDKSWSLTDCLSMEVMLDAGCQEAATPDHHFEQAGFVALLRA